MLFLHIFPANIEALSDLWIIGDHFLCDLAPALQRRHRTAALANKTQPFIHERFNVFTFYQSPVTFDTFACIANALIDGINRRIKVPRYLIVMPDRDLINATDYFNFGISKLLGICTNWLAKRLERLLEACRENLMDKRPGALQVEETEIIWVKMINRPPVLLTDCRYKTQATREKFNSTIDCLPDWRRNTIVMSVNSLNMDCDFDVIGNLNDDRKIQFWKELDHHVKMYICRKM